MERVSTAEHRIYALWIEASAAVMIVGVFGSWATVGGSGVSGTSAGSRGWVVLTAALLAGAVLLFRRGTRSAGVYVAAIGIVAVAAVAYDRTHLGDAIGASSATEAAARAGWGVNLALGASVSLTVAGLAWAVAMNRLPWSWLAPTVATGGRDPSAIELAARDEEPSS
jgi:hypothetical protein